MNNNVLVILLYKSILKGLSTSISISFYGIFPTNVFMLTLFLALAMLMPGESRAGMAYSTDALQGFGAGGRAAGPLKRLIGGLGPFKRF